MKLYSKDYAGWGGVRGGLLLALFFIFVVSLHAQKVDLPQWIPHKPVANADELTYFIERNFNLELPDRYILIMAPLSTEKHTLAHVLYIRERELQKLFPNIFRVFVFTKEANITEKEYAKLITNVFKLPIDTLHVYNFVERHVYDSLFSLLEQLDKKVKSWWEMHEIYAYVWNDKVWTIKLAKTNSFRKQYLPGVEVMIELEKIYALPDTLLLGGSFSKTFFAADGIIRIEKLENKVYYFTDSSVQVVFEYNKDSVEQWFLRDVCQTEEDRRKAKKIGFLTDTIYNRPALRVHGGFWLNDNKVLIISASMEAPDIFKKENSEQSARDIEGKRKAHWPFRGYEVLLVYKLKNVRFIGPKMLTTYRGDELEGPYAGKVILSGEYIPIGNNGSELSLIGLTTLYTPKLDKAIFYIFPHLAFPIWMFMRKKLSMAIGLNLNLNRDTIHFVKGYLPYMPLKRLFEFSMALHIPFTLDSSLYFILNPTSTEVWLVGKKKSIGKISHKIKGVKDNFRKVDLVFGGKKLMGDAPFPWWFATLSGYIDAYILALYYRGRDMYLQVMNRKLEPVAIVNVSDLEPFRLCKSEFGDANEKIVNCLLGNVSFSLNGKKLLWFINTSSGAKIFEYKVILK